MLLVVMVLQIVLVGLGVMLLVRRPGGNGEGLAGDLRELRRDAGAEAAVTREANGRAFAELRQEVVASLGGIAGQLHGVLAQAREDQGVAAVALRAEVQGRIDAMGGTLKTELAAFRADNAGAAGKLHAEVREQHEGIVRRLGASAGEAREHQDASREALHTRLTELAAANTGHQERLRTTVQERLDALNAANAAKLEEMRATVDEKLHATLHTRLTESFGQVTDQLNKVHTGLGEMSKLSEGVDGLSRIFTNVKSRGGFAEVQLGMLLEQMLAPSQFVRNAKVKPNTGELVEFAVRFPGHSGETLLPIDAKFPREAWERLETAYAANDGELLVSAGKAFEAAIRTEGKRICEKYINPPLTTPHAIMFLPTEGLYAEVMRRDALQAEIQSKMPG